MQQLHTASQKTKAETPEQTVNAVRDIDWEKRKTKDKATTTSSSHESLTSCSIAGLFVT